MNREFAKWLKDLKDNWENVMEKTFTEKHTGLIEEDLVLFQKEQDLF